MARPQQPEIERSGHTDVDPDHSAEVAGREPSTGRSRRAGPVPPANRPGHHDALDQDKPPGPPPDPSPTGPAERDDPPPKAAKSGKGGKSAKSGKAAKTPKADEGARTPKAGKSTKTPKAGGEKARATKPGTTTEAAPVTATGTGKAGKATKAGTTTKAAGSGKAGKAGAAATAGEATDVTDEAPGAASRSAASAVRAATDDPGPAGTPDGGATARRRFEFAFEGRLRPAAAAFGVLPSTAHVELDGDDLHVRFGLWSLRTPIANVAGTEVTGPYRWWKVAGPAHISLADGGVTFATTTRAGLCIRFHEPVPAAVPKGLLRHSSATVTVADPAALADALAAATG